MRTVKEISDLTGISVRTLHYYDEIGLLKPTEKSDAGYRLYDDKALETLQQILFFREFDISLKEIKAVLDNPALDRNQILQVQRKMLVTKKERMERLIASIDDILKGENKMDFTIFTKTEVEEMFQTMLEHMPENMRNIAIKEFGSIEQWKKHYMEVVSSEEMQKGYAKVVEWYGGKDKFLSVARTPVSKEVAESYNKRIETILQKLIAKQNCDIDSFEVKELVGEYGFVMKQFSQIKEEKSGKQEDKVIGRTVIQIIGTDSGKDDISNHLKIQEPGPGYCHFPEDTRRGYGEEYYKGLVSSEYRVEKKVNGYYRATWVQKKGTRNEPLDLFNYNYAVEEILRPDWDKLQAQLEKGINYTKKRVQKKKVTRHVSKGIEV